MPVASMEIPATMQAAVWRGGSTVCVETVPVPAIGAGELLVRVEACGLCPTDIKKIDHALVAPPVILGHELVGRVAAAGAGAAFWTGRRVVVYHHVPCRACRLCALGLYSQCEGYKRTGTTAGFAPAGGGWAQYIRVCAWIVAGGGVVDVPEDMPARRAILMEPVNTCLKCVEAVPAGARTLVILGQGPVGLMLAALARRRGMAVYAVEPLEERRAYSARFGVCETFAPDGDLARRIRDTAPPLGPDAAIAATESEAAIGAALQAVRFGGTVVLFAHPRTGHALTVDGGPIGMAEKRLIGSYSSSVELNTAVKDALLDTRIPWEILVTDVMPMREINAALDRARRPRGGSLKLAVVPGEDG